MYSPKIPAAALCCRRFKNAGGLEISVPKPEHIVAMKVKAVQANPDRFYKDLGDVLFFLKRPDVDENEVRGYFEKAGLGRIYTDMRRLVDGPSRS